MCIFERIIDSEQTVPDGAHKVHARLPKCTFTKFHGYMLAAKYFNSMLSTTVHLDDASLEVAVAAYKIRMVLRICLLEEDWHDMS